MSENNPLNRNNTSDEIKNNSASQTFFDKTLGDIDRTESTGKNDSNYEAKNKKSKERDCLNLKKIFLRSSPKLIILKSAEDLCSAGVRCATTQHDSPYGRRKKPLNNDELSSYNNTDTKNNSAKRFSSNNNNNHLHTDANNTNKKQCNKKKGHSVTGLMLRTLIGAAIAILASMSLIWTPFEILMNERLKMVRGLPAYDWWLNPPDEVLLRVYVFNITNAEAFLDGSEKKLRLDEIGPYIFREKLEHSDVRFHDNGTMTYRSHRTAVFFPELNELSLNATLIVPNLALLGMSSYLWDANFLTKIGFNLLLNKLDSQPILSSTVYNYFWNFSDPLVRVARSIVPHLVPVDNMGILQQIYHKFSDEVTVYYGPHNGRRFFTLDQFNGESRLGYWQNETCDTVQGSTEGVTYHQGIRKNDTLKYLRKTMCRVTPLYFKKALYKLGMKAYRFDLPMDVFSQPTDGHTAQCFNKPGYPDLPTGLNDASPCYYDFPVAVSFPHYMNADPIVCRKLEGLKEPDPEKHGSFVIVEPTTGVPMESRARSQSNLVMRPVKGIKRVEKFSDMYIPIFWAEYNQVGLPWYITALMYFTVIILPVSQFYISVSFIIFGLSLCIFTFYRLTKRKKFDQKPLYSYSSLDLLPSTPSTGSEC
ncbi:scavenger receptor class B member 1-like [Lycorma delicatula]|uniref:scavenger receptor class B member 1-like n=1 Tax=Lycorma delicatula TaxID=130591 RepID=UPI003F51854C